MLDVEFHIYLDSADLLEISDGKAAGVDELREAMEYAGGTLLVSAAHLVDLAAASEETRARWVDGLEVFAPVRFAIEPGHGEYVPRNFFAELLKDSLAFDTMRQAMTAYDNVHDAVRSTGVQKLPVPSRRQIRRGISLLQDGELDARLSGVGDEGSWGSELVSTLDSLRALGFSPDDMAEAALARPADALDAGDLPEYVRRSLGADRGRRARHSDIADVAHLRFALCADIFTADANIESVLRGVHGRSINVPGRAVDTGSSSICFRVGQLARVADALCVIADEWREAQRVTTSETGTDVPRDQT